MLRSGVHPPNRSAEWHDHSPWPRCGPQCCQRGQAKRRAREIEYKATEKPSSSECLPNAKENVEATGVLRNKDRYCWIIRVWRLQTRKCRWIQIVAEIESHRSNGSFITYANSDGVRNIAVVALAGRALLKAQFRIFLPPAQQVVQHLVSIGEDVAGIMKDSETNIVLKERQRSGRKSQLQIIQE